MDLETFKQKFSDGAKIGLKEAMKNGSPAKVIYNSEEIINEMRDVEEQAEEAEEKYKSQKRRRK